MSLILAGLAVGASGVVAVGRWLARRGNRAEPAQAKPADQAKPGDEPKPPPAPKPAEEVSKKMGRRDPEGSSAHLTGFPCQLGDVLMRLTGEEAWLAGGIVLAEEGPVAALFVAPDAGHDCVIYARPHPREAIFWLAPLDPGAVLVGGEPPTSVEHGGVRFDRVRRLPLRAKRIGVGAPDVDDVLVLAEYASAGCERLLVLRSSSGASHAYRGEELEPSSFEVIASGRATLDED